MKKLILTAAFVLAAAGAQANCYRDIDGTTKCWNGSESYTDSDSNYSRAQQYLCDLVTDEDGNAHSVCHWE